MRLFFFIVYFSPAFGICQNTIADRNFSELKEWNLKGKIKKITNYIFDNVDSKFEHAKFIDTAKCSRLNIVAYDEKGNANSFESVAKSKMGRVTMKSESKISYFPNKRVSIDILNGDTFSVSIRQWISDTAYTDTIKNTANQNIGLNITVLDKKGNIKSQRIESLKEYDISKPVTIFFKFNERNQLSEIVTKSENGSQIIETNKDIAFDNIGNSIKSIKHQNTKRTLIIRKYEYY